MRFNQTQFQGEDAEIQMAPLIDIIFLLLIFFMIISNLHQLEGAKGVRLPVADQSKTIKNSYGQITLNVMADGTIILDQQVLDLSGLVAVLSNRPVEATKVLIRGDRGVPIGRVLEVMKACAQANIWNISFATFQEETSPLPPSRKKQKNR